MTRSALHRNQIGSSHHVLRLLLSPNGQSCKLLNFFLCRLAEYRRHLHWTTNLFQDLLLQGRWAMSGWASSASGPICHSKDTQYLYFEDNSTRFTKFGNSRYSSCSSRAISEAKMIAYPALPATDLFRWPPILNLMNNLFSIPREGTYEVCFIPLSVLVH